MPQVKQRGASTEVPVMSSNISAVVRTSELTGLAAAASAGAASSGSALSVIGSTDYSDSASDTSTGAGS